ncbi:MAG: phosphatase PAP2 family protein, partial [Oscillospiraceae bacterium]|nr:phosphatase PAP2 family protein [Oscillospiraceae bacterium]
AIGPQESVVGFAGINGAFHKFTGVHMAIYDLTDLLSVIPLAIVAAFGLLGVVQWIKRKSLKAVDYDIWVLGGFYVVVMAVFLLFENLDVNFRPILIEGVLEASYPSSTTMLAMCVLPTAMLQLKDRIKNRGLRICVLILLALFTAFMVIGRLISGVHWLTDIIGGALFSTGLLLLYNAFVRLKK